jgi:hypothetical protein
MVLVVGFGNNLMLSESRKQNGGNFNDFNSVLLPCNYFNRDNGDEPGGIGGIFGRQRVEFLRDQSGWHGGMLGPRWRWYSP